MAILQMNAAVDGDLGKGAGTVAGQGGQRFFF